MSDREITISAACQIASIFSAFYPQERRGRQGRRENSPNSSGFFTLKQSSPLSIRDKVAIAESMRFEYHQQGGTADWFISNFQPQANDKGTLYFVEPDKAKPSTPLKEDTLSNQFIRARLMERTIAAERARMAKEENLRQKYGVQGHLISLLDSVCAEYTKFGADDPDGTKGQRPWLVDEDDAEGYHDAKREYGALREQLVALGPQAGAKQVAETIKAWGEQANFNGYEPVSASTIDGRIYHLEHTIDNELYLLHEKGEWAAKLERIEQQHGPQGFLMDLLTRLDKKYVEIGIGVRQHSLKERLDKN